MGRMNAPAPVRLALIGLMGAGKSRVGRLCARALDWPFVDADREAERDAGLSLPRLFAGRGEAGFREVESAVLARLAGLPAPLVVATGGGVVEREGNRRVLAREFTVVWLRVDPAEAARRLAGGSGRPLLAAGEPAVVLAGLAASRDPLYAALADHVLDTGPDTRPEDLRDGLLDLLGAS